MEGTYTVGTSTYSDCSIKMASSTALVGQGASTIIELQDNFDEDINVICNSDTTNGDYRILLSDFKLDGSGNNSGTQHGIYFEKVGSGTSTAALPGAKIENLWVENFRDRGIYLATSSNNTLSGNTCQGNSDDGIALSSSSNNTLSGNTCQGNTGNGIYLSSSSNNTLSGNTCQGNSDEGIGLSSSSNNNTLSGNTCQGNSGQGIFLYSSPDNTISGNTCQGNTGNGIYLYSSSDSTISGNTCQRNGLRGIYIHYYSKNNTISGNSCVENSQLLNDQYDNIRLATDCTYNLIIGNICRQGTLANKPRYGIRLESDCDYNVIQGNDLYSSGATGDLSDAGTGNIKSNNRTTNNFLVVANASSTNVALAVTQTGSGNIVNVSNATGTVFTIANDGTVTVAGDILPSTTTAYDLGSDTYRWRYIYSATSVMEAFQMDTGASSTYILTSDGSGIGTWQPAPATGGEERYGPTLIVAAQNSTNTSRAHYQCDGTNDEEQINLAIDALSSTGGTVLLLEGTYDLATSTYSDRSIEITTSSVALVGSGANTVLKLKDSFGADIYLIYASSKNHLLISNLKLDGNKANNNTPDNFYGIIFSSITDSKIENCWIENFESQAINWGISLGNSSHNVLSGNTFRNNMAYSIYLGSADSNTITGNHFSASGITTGSVDWAPIFLDTDSDYNLVTGNNVDSWDNGICIQGTNNTISGNNIAAKKHGVYIYFGDYNSVTGNNINNSFNNGIYIYNNATYNTITGNSIYNSTYNGIRLETTSHNNSLTGNVINGVGAAYNGIKVETDNNIISSNRIHDSSAQYGTDVSSGSNNYLISNEITGTFTANIRDLGTNTTIQQRDWFEVEASTLSVNYPLTLITSVDTTWTTGTETYLGIVATSTFSGNLVDIQKAGTSEFVIDNNGNLSVHGNIMPSTTTAYDLGSDTYRWRYIYSATSDMDAFKMDVNATSGYVLTSDDSGVGTTKSRSTQRSQLYLHKEAWLS